MHCTNSLINSWGCQKIFICIFMWFWFWKESVKVLVTQSCPTLCNPMDYRRRKPFPAGEEPARLLCPWNSPSKNTGVVSHSLSRESSWPRDWTWVPCIAGGFLIIWATIKCSCLHFDSGMRSISSITWSTDYHQHQLHQITTCLLQSLGQFTTLSNLELVHILNI